MKFFSKNLSKLLLISLSLIVLGMIYDVQRFFDSNHLISQISIVFQLIAYLFALNYISKGYRKTVAGSYSIFLLTYEASLILTFIRSFVIGKSTIFSFTLLIIQIICVLILTFVKNLGKNTSYILVSINMLACIVKIAKQVFTAPHLYTALSSSLSGFVLGFVFFVLVIAKYVDKDSRGSL